MALRTAHGRAKQLGAVVVVETLPADELPSASGSDPARRDRDDAGRFLPGNRLAKAAKFRAGRHGRLAALEAQGDPAWLAADRWGKQWAAHRRTELAVAHGGELSAEVSAIVEDAGQAMADARYCRARAAAVEASDPARAERLRTEARQLRIEARGHRLAAWEIAAKEAQARPAADPLAAARARINATHAALERKGGG
jgi:hypothetical protein